MNDKRILLLFTRTPLHVGAGSSVGAIDQPITRERHTGFPIVPASSLKGTFADGWNEGLLDEVNDRGDRKRVRVKKDGTASDAAWLFGSDSDKHAAAGSLQFSEARLLAFPIRSAVGTFSWITCPLVLQRATRDDVFDSALMQGLQEPKDEEAIFDAGSSSKLALSGAVVLEEYKFKSANNWSGLARLSETLHGLLADEPVWTEVKDRLVILSNGMMSFFTQNACEVAQHVRISDETGTAESGALFNQENVPSETLFYSVLRAFDERGASNARNRQRKADEALGEFAKKVDGNVFQFGGDASTGLGYCTVNLKNSNKI